MLVDITPHSLGIKCMSTNQMGMEFMHQFAPIIHRSSPLPASQSDVFYTAVNNQKGVEIDVYQGEESDVRRNHRVGRFNVEGLSPVPAGNPLVVQLDLTLDGVLKVSARERATGLSKQVTIENALAKFQREERAVAQERLDQLWADQEDGTGGDFDDLMGNLETALGGVPDDEDAPTPEMPLAPGPRDGHRETMQARALLEKAQRLMDKASADDQGEVKRLMEKVQTAMTAQQWDRVSTATNELADTLFYLEDA